MSFDEISLSNRVLSLRESSEDRAALVGNLQDELSINDREAEALATVLEDRFVSPEERLDLLGSLELRGVLVEGSSVGGFITRLSGLDGREAARHHARALASSLNSESTGGENAAVSDEAIRELAAALPRHGVAAGVVSPISYGMYSYFARDSAMSSLAAAIRGNWESSTDPILRMRSARVLAATGDAEAASFLRESVAALAVGYSGPIGFDERIARAAGLAIDGNEAAARFLQNVAMNPDETVGRRSTALGYLPPASLDNGSDTAEVFRSLVEDPEEPVATRYLMMSVLARAPHPPEASWWQRMLNDPTMTINDRNASGGAGAAGNTSPEFSQWNLVIAALGSSHADFASTLLRETIFNRGATLLLRREALMAYVHQNGRGNLPWDVLREVLGLPAGEWNGILEEVEIGDRPLRLHFPRAPAANELESSERVENELVLEVHRHGAEWEVSFRPLNRAHDSVVRPSTPPAFESYMPRNRRIALGGIEAEEITSEVLTPTPVSIPAPGSSETPLPFSEGGSGTGPTSTVGESRHNNAGVTSGASSNPIQRENSANSETRRGI